MIRTTVRLPEDLLAEAKAHARRTGRTHTSGDVSYPQPAQLSSAQRERSATHLLEQVQELQAFLRALPDLDHRSPDEILGYNADGIPE